jgi:hypothetical protein
MRFLSVLDNASMNLSWVHVLGALVALGAFVAVLIFLAPRRSYVGRPILTANELEFWRRLIKALPEYTVLTQVSMSALIEPAVHPGHRRFRELRNRFAQKYVDYVVCDQVSLQVVAIIELDDRTHDPIKDAARDAMLNEAGYTVVRWESRAKPSVKEIAHTIAGCQR